ncbi:ACH10-like protein [Mya arenaria]|uniref:ACH10-like protein n=1 Tax=Mya arenaria TaxID=6604 RepID=A0ABY7DSH2_MYAAR|nr:ACH10-like protein [Mya arenaria]
MTKYPFGSNLLFPLALYYSDHLFGVSICRLFHCAAHGGPRFKRMHVNVMYPRQHHCLFQIDDLTAGYSIRFHLLVGAYTLYPSIVYQHRFFWTLPPFEWVDEFMRWDPDEFANITTLRVPCNKLWLPDIVLYNKLLKDINIFNMYVAHGIFSAAEYTDGLMPANAMVRYDGNIFWPIPTKLQSSCKVDVTYFPFDEQECYMKFGSWTYDGFQVDITNRTEQVDLSNYVNNGEWELVSIRIERNVVTYSCCPEPFPDVKFYIHIRRRTLYYMYNVIFPCIMMSALTLLVFCLPPDSGEKIALGITVLLAFSVFMLAVAENLPETSEFVPLISIYLTIVMGLTSMSVIMTVFVLNLHHRGPNKRAVPRWIKEILVNKMAPYLCLQEEATRDHRRFYDNEEQFIKNVSLKITLDNIQQALQNESKIESNEQCNETNSVDSERVTSKEQEGDCLNVPGVTIYHPVRAEHTTSSSCNHSSYSTSHQNSKSVTANSPVSQTQQYFQYNPQTSQFSSTTQNIYPNPHTESASLHPNHKQTSPNKHDNNRKGRHRTTSPLSKTNEEILHSLKRILEKHEKEDRDYEVIQEWRRVAQAVDRILFFIFLLATFASTLGLLVVAPAIDSLTSRSTSTSSVALSIYYMYNLIFPCILMSALNLPEFSLPPDYREKIALDETPWRKKPAIYIRFVPNISLFFTIVMGLTSSSVIMTVFVLNLHQRGPNKCAMPRWIKEILVNKMAPYLCLQEEATRDHGRYNENDELFIPNVSLKITQQYSTGAS